MQQNNLLNNRKIYQIRAEVDTALKEHGEEVHQSGKQMKWAPELNKCVMRRHFTAAKGAGPVRRDQYIYNEGIVELVMEDSRVGEKRGFGHAASGEVVHTHPLGLHRHSEELQSSSTEIGRASCRERV